MYLTSPTVVNDTLDAKGVGAYSITASTRIVILDGPLVLSDGTEVHGAGELGAAPGNMSETSTDTVSGQKTFVLEDATFKVIKAAGPEILSILPNGDVSIIGTLAMSGGW